MGIFKRMQEEGMAIQDVLLEKRTVKKYINDLEQLPLDDEDRKNIALIKRIFGAKHRLTPKKIDVLKQRDFMYNNSKRFICVLNRNNETGGGFQEYYGFREFEQEYKKYIRQKEKMMCFSTLYSKFPTSEGATRTLKNINRTSIFSQDLDAGKKGMPIEEQLQRIADLIDKQKIFMPNFIMFSGTGIQLFWFIDNLMMKPNSKVHKTWVNIQKTMYSAFEEAGLDPDASVFKPYHNTRMLDTLNERAKNKIVRGYILHTERSYFSDHISFHFSHLHNDVVKKKPTKKEKQASKTGKVIKSPKFWGLRSYAWGMIEDMKLIPILKNHYNESIIGWRWRMATIVRFFSLIYWEGDENRALKEVETWWNGLTSDQQEDTSLKEIIRRSKTAVKYYKQFKEGEPGEKKYKRPGLFYKNKTLVEELQLSVQMQLQLNIIKIRSYKDETGQNKTNKKWDTEYERERNKQRRKQKGVKTHSEKKKAKIEAIKSVLEVNPKASAREIERKTGISNPTVSKYLKEFGLRG